MGTTLHIIEQIDIRQSWRSIVLHCIVLYCIALYCIALHCIALCCIVLHGVAYTAVVLSHIILMCVALIFSKSFEPQQNSQHFRIVDVVFRF